MSSISPRFSNKPGKKKLMMTRAKSFNPDEDNDLLTTPSQARLSQPISRKLVNKKTNSLGPETLCPQRRMTVKRSTDSLIVKADLEKSNRLKELNKLPMKQAIQAPTNLNSAQKAKYQLTQNK
jgi:hypothetical protein